MYKIVMIILKEETKKFCLKSVELIFKVKLQVETVLCDFIDL